MPPGNHTPEEIARHEWVRANKGILQRIANELGFSRTLVSRVYNGHQSSYTGKIEEKLRSLDAPGWTPRKGAKKA